VTLPVSNLVMDSFWGVRRITPALTVAVLFVCAAASITWCVLLRFPDGLGASAGERMAECAVLGSPLAFLCACVLVFVRTRFGYCLGLVAGLIALPWFVWTESLLTPVNSWVFLNTGGESVPEALALLAFAKLKILSMALIVFAVLCSALRLLPARLAMRGSPLCQRTWPAVALGLLVLATWFARSVVPYREPIIVDGVSPEFRILHVEKRGLRYHETEVYVFRDGLAWVRRNDRRLFQYRFESRVAMIVLGDVSLTTLEHARSFMKLSELRSLPTPPAKALRSWNAEGWYVALRDSRPLAFSSEYRTVPPREVADLLYEIEGLPARQGQATVRDVCLGFCYNPVAGFSEADGRDSKHR